MGRPTTPMHAKYVRQLIIELGEDYELRVVELRDKLQELIEFHKVTIFLISINSGLHIGTVSEFMHKRRTNISLKTYKSLKEAYGKLLKRYGQ